MADISALTPGALALNDKAKAALEPFLLRFGQLLEMDCEGEPRWFYNVTNVVSCIDEARSEKRPTGTLSKEAFSGERVPAEAAVFKDPLTAPVKIYVKDPASRRWKRSSRKPTSSAPHSSNLALLQRSHGLAPESGSREAGAMNERELLATLQAENARLTALLESHGIAWRLSPTAPSHPT
ncbi:MAG: hypothetical protein ACJ8IK_03215 [Burkholderiaceae bacterium]